MRLNIAQSVLMACSYGAPYAALDIEAAARNGEADKFSGPRHNASFTKKGPGRRFAGRKAQAERHPVTLRYHKAHAKAVREGYGTICNGAPYGVMLPEDQVRMRDGVVYIQADGHRHRNFGKVRVA